MGWCVLCVSIPAVQALGGVRRQPRYMRQSASEKLLVHHVVGYRESRDSIVHVSKLWWGRMVRWWEVL